MIRINVYVMVINFIIFISRYTGLKLELSTASALDPRFKALPFLFDDEREEIFAHLITITEALGMEKNAVSKIYIMYIK